MPPHEAAERIHTPVAALPLHVLEAARFGSWRDALAPALRAWVDAQAFTASAGSLVLLPGEHGMAGAAIGIGDPLDPYSYAHAPFALPPGDWTPDSALEAGARAALQLGWGLGSYRFDRYRKATRAPARLVLAGNGADAEAFDLLAACTRVRDLVNTPPTMVPQAIWSTWPINLPPPTRAGAGVCRRGTAGAELPAVHAVGRPSHRAPP